MTRLADSIDFCNNQHLETGELPMTIRLPAKISAVPERTVYRHVKGEASMSLKRAIAFARALGHPPKDLVEGAPQ